MEQFEESWGPPVRNPRFSSPQERLGGYQTPEGTPKGAPWGRKPRIPYRRSSTFLKLPNFFIFFWKKIDVQKKMKWRLSPGTKMVLYSPEEPFPSQGSKKTDLVRKALGRLWDALGSTLGRLGGSKGEIQGQEKRGPMERNHTFHEFQ